MNKTDSLKVSRQRLEQAHVRRPNDRLLLTELMQVLEELDAYADLQQLLAEAIARWPHDSSLLMCRARIQTYLGNFLDARETYQAILQFEPGHIGALCSMVMQGHGEAVGGLASLETRLAATDITNAERDVLHYARARLLEKSQRFDEAFDTLRQANAGRAAAGGMDLAAKQRGARAVLSDINVDTLKRCGGRGNLSKRPVFIVGMPRSGTTLTEQVLASHPDVHAAGERLFWGGVLAELIRSAPRHEGSMIDAINSSHADVWKNAGNDYLHRINEIDSESLRFTDKLPANFTLLPFIRLIFPQARILHIRRDPLATIASCIRAPFSDPALAFTVEGWARFYGMYEALMERWRPLLGDQLLELDYEDLVSDLPTQARRLIHFLGLNWDDACLHPELNRRAVRTASAQQVRREVHTESIDAWRCYARQLEVLRPCLEKSRALVLSQPVGDD
jgi:tetratricopeptide (TPR) repeat protein